MTILRKIFSPLIILLLIFSFSNAQARGHYRFGKSETITFLQNIDLKGPNGENLYLGYKTSIMNFIAGIYLKKDGYVLGSVNDKRHYIS